MKHLWNVIYGAIIGIANIIPGVSGGTMAVILDIYDELISAVSNLRKDFKKNLMFLIPIGLGAGVGIILFSKLIEFLLGSYPMPINFFFMGLIVGSIPMIYKRATAASFKVVSLIPFLVTFGIMIAMTFMGEGESTSAAITTLGVGNVIKLILGSAVSAACMIVPGVSGSLVMMILGLYTTVLTAISQFNILVLGVIGIGVLIGILGGAKLIAICLEKFEQMTFMAILGLIIGSIFPVYQNSGFTFSVEGVIAIVVLGLGIALALLFASEKFKNLVAKTK